MPSPIFVVGFQRSGTTLLQELLGGHPEIVAAPEVHYFFRIYDLRDYYGDLGDDRNLRRVVEDLLHPPIPLLDDCGFDADRLFRRVRARGADYASLLDELLRDLAEREGAQRWSEKSPGQPLARIFELFPDAQALHITRDVVDVVASSMATTWNDRSASELARQWARFERATSAMTDRLTSAEYLPIRYEDLVRSPREQLARICEFLDVQPCVDEMLAGQSRMSAVPRFALGWLSKVGQPIDTASVGRGREDLSKQQQAEIRAAADGPADPVSSSADRPDLTPQQRWELTQEFFRELNARAKGE